MKARSTTKKILEVLDLFETLTLDTIKRHEDRLTGFVKLYQSGIKTPKDLYSAAMAHERWTDSLLIFVTRRVFDSKARHDMDAQFQKPNLTSEEKKKKEQFENLLTSLQDVFEAIGNSKDPFTHDSSSTPLISGEDEEGFGADEVPINPARQFDPKVWGGIYLRWSQNRDWTEDMDYFAKFERMFKYIRDFFIFVGGDSPKVYDSYKFHKYRIGTYIIKLIYEEDEEDQRKKAMEMLGKIRKVIDIFKAKNLEKLLKRPVSFAIDATPNEMVVGGTDLSSGGYYQPNVDLPVTRSDSLHTVIHEIGHRYYHQFMSKESRIVWTKLIKEGFVKTQPFLTQNQVDSLIKILKGSVSRETWLKEWFIGSTSYNSLDPLKTDPHLAERLISFLEVVVSRDSSIDRVTKNLFVKALEHISWSKELQTFLGKYLLSVLTKKTAKQFADNKKTAVITPEMISKFEGAFDIIQTEVIKLVSKTKDKISTYQENDPNEQWAEAFAAFCLGEELPNKVENFLEQELK